MGTKYDLCAKDKLLICSIISYNTYGKEYKGKCIIYRLLTKLLIFEMDLLALCGISITNHFQE
jgi:hypothetical protein